MAVQLDIEKACRRLDWISLNNVLLTWVSMTD